MNGEIRKFLFNNGRPHGGHTHVTLIDPIGKWYIGKTHRSEWWKLYCDSVQDEELLGVAEEPEDRGPLRIDIDFRYDVGSLELRPPARRYTLDHVKGMITRYNEVIRKVIQCDNDSILLCVVLEKPNARYKEKGKSIVADGFHLHYPFCIVTREIQDTILRTLVIEKLKHDDVFQNMDLTNKIENILDADCAKKTWLLYGSVKEAGLVPYKVTHIFNDKLEELTLAQAFERDHGSFYNDNLDDDDDLNLDLDNEKDANVNGMECAIRKTENASLTCSLASVLGISMTEDEKELEPDIEYCLPILLSIRGKTTICKLNDKFVEEFKRKEEIKHLPPAYKIYKKATKEEYKQNLKVAKELLRLISVKTVITSRQDWLDVGYCLFNIGGGSEDALDLWDEFSRKDNNKYVSRESLMKYWDTMRPGKWTIGSLKRWAKMSNPREYDSWANSNVTGLITKSIALGRKFEIAAIVKQLFGDNYVCSDISKKTWYYFDGVRWIRSDDAHTLRIKLSTDLTKVYEKYRKEYITSKRENDEDEDGDDGERKKADPTLKKIKKIIKDLGEPGSKSSIIRECADLLYDPLFEDKLDQNEDLICFTNGIYDLSITRFREGSPFDYVSKCTNIPFIEAYTKDHEHVKQINMIFKMILVNKDLRKYTRRFFATCLKGGNMHKIYFILMGASGDNGKSSLTAMLEEAFGEYFVKLPTSLITKQRTQSSNATPETAQLRGAKIAVTQETDKGEYLNIGVLKEWTGRDSVYVRGLYKTGGKMRVHAKFITHCNKLPRTPGYDKAYWNRAKIILCDSTFVSDPPDTLEECFRQKRFRVDPLLDVKIKECASAFMWILTEEFKQYKKYGMEEPQIIKDTTQAYKNKNDVTSRFIAENLKQDKNSEVSLKQLYPVFKKWFQDVFSSRKIPNEEELEDDLAVAISQPEPGCIWKGYRIDKSVTYSGEAERKLGKSVKEQETKGEDLDLE
jgi:P4 family phage/plasmid primase-like protien